ncbi:MAG: type II 3-dehydroquinate dehydratase, partial [Candidatus Fermentibacterota bacterium]
MGPHRVMLLNGPNMAALGEREPEVYGSSSLASLEEELCSRADGLGLVLEPLQTDSETKSFCESYENKAIHAGFPVITYETLDDIRLEHG